MGFICRWFPFLCKQDLVVPEPISNDFLLLLNNLRAKQSLKPMKSDDRVTKLAQDWANQQAKSDVMSHGDFPKRVSKVFPNTWCAENVGMNTTDTSKMFSAWTKSSGHYDNMMGDYTHAGFGLATSKSGKIYYCADFVRINTP